MKIHLSPAAVAVGNYIIVAMSDAPPAVVCTDGDLAAATGLKPDTCYRAVRELTDVGALHDEPRIDGVRHLRPIHTSWVWAALTQSGVAR